MSTITITDLISSDLADEEAFNSRFGIVATKLNTGLDTDNLLAGAVTRAKVGQASITAAKMDNTFTWIAPTYTSGWATHVDIIYGTGAQYYKDMRGTVRMCGLVRRASGTSATIFTLPVGYRPDKRLIFTLLNDNILSRVDISPAGEVLWVTGNNIASWTSLANIQFRAVQ